MILRTIINNKNYLVFNIIMGWPKIQNYPLLINFIRPTYQMKYVCHTTPVMSSI